MKLFTCPGCGATLVFENLTCACGTEVAWDDRQAGFVPAAIVCANRPTIGCNWTAAEEGSLCRACSMSEVIPDTDHGNNLSLWTEAEVAKRWVLANLQRWGWFSADDPGPLPVFHLIAEAILAGEVQVTMGHADGVITFNVSEADPAERVARRQALGERFRTLVGHFRHELAHFLFERLKEKHGFLDAFRTTFGDERTDYASALERHYREGPPAGWQENCVTPYASSHPHEDWAESTAHVLHLTDIADSFAAAGLDAPSLPGPDYDAYTEADGRRLIVIGAELGIALNHVNRAMGLADLYPFILTPTIREKLAFVHRWVREAA